MSGGFGQRIRLRLFLEGVEVPVIAASVQVAPNSPSACTIQIPPLPEGTRLFPRTLVHLFFLDLYEAQSPFAPVQPSNPSVSQSPTSYENVQNPSPAQPMESSGVGDDKDLNNARYKLLFGGEVIGYQWTKNQAQRSLVLQCQDWSNYWDYAYQWNNTDLFGPGVKAIFSGGSTNLFTDFLEDEGSAILRIIQTPSVQYPNLKGLLGGLVHLLEAIGGSYYYGKQFAGQNIFFSIAELRLHITQMITAYENDPTASRLIGGGYDSLFGRTLGGLGQQVSIRQALNALMGMIFHETYAQPCPYYAPGTGNNSSGTVRNSVRKDPNNAFVATTADALLQSIASVQSQLSAPSTPPTPGASGAVTGAISNMRSTCAQTVSQMTDPSVATAKSYYSSASRSLATAQSLVRQWQPGSNASIISGINAQLSAAMSQLQKAADFEAVTNVKTASPARLCQQIFRPDVWFSAPPRCNVIFPEHYHSMTFVQMFLQEPTRLLLKTNNEFYGEDELFDQFYFAPKGFTLKSGGRELQNILSNDLLDHELFSGILPVFEKMGELNIFGARSGSTPGGKTPKIGLAQRSCNFLYFKYRFAARQMQVNGKFNPYLAAGFPAVILDKYVNADALALREQLIAQAGGIIPQDTSQLLGTNFLANLTEVTHNVDQTSGSTSLNCSYARQPDERIEFLGVIRPDQTVQKQTGQTAARTSVAAAISPPSVNAQGPQGGIISAVQEVTSAYQGQSLPLYQGPTRAGTNVPRINVVVGTTQPASNYGLNVVQLVGSQTIPVMFRAYKITESISTYSRVTVDLPAEEYIRPGWYGDCWHPSLIGQVYQAFFNTGSITDQQIVTQGNTSLSVAYAAAQAALAQAQKALDADDPAAWAAGLMTLDQGSSIQDSVAFLVQLYSKVKLSGADVNDFVSSYTWRPIATMVDLFGTSDLMLDPTGHSVVQGVEGFHSRAFGQFSDLYGLVTSNIENVLGLKRNSTAAQKGDVRKRKQDAVLLYVSALSYARAILG